MASIRLFSKLALVLLILFVAHMAFVSKTNYFVDTFDSQNEVQNCNFEDYILGHPISQEDPCLVATIKKRILIPPSNLPKEDREERKLSNEIKSNKEKFMWIEQLLIKSSESPQRGFFIECGANDGFYNSATIKLERLFDWTGLLIEANPKYYEKLLQSKRNAWLVGTALCPTDHPEQVVLHVYPNFVGVAQLGENKVFGEYVNETIQCLPLYSILAAINVTTVDYFNLDIEGFELAVLKTLLFDKIKFKVLTVEHQFIPEKLESLKQFLESKGYKFVKEITDKITMDGLFVHESLYQSASSIKIQ